MEICTIENCLKPLKAKGLCSMHHQRMLRHGDPNTVRPRRVKIMTECEWVSCRAPATTRGLCPKHYYIFRVTQTPNV
ncbi:MAG: hypothetical protein K0Q63_842 [Paenibacillus sp.]|jgi:hypothetical protein|nr:hypothetical protein [Paenibacillus sp.]